VSLIKKFSEMAIFKLVQQIEEEEGLSEEPVDEGFEEFEEEEFPENEEWEEESEESWEEELEETEEA